MVMKMRRTISDIAKVAQSARQQGQQKIVSSYELSQWLGITERRIQQLAKEGLPRVGRGDYKLRESVVFYIGYLQRLLEENNNNTILAEKIRMMRAKATKAEIDAEKAGGSVLNAQKVGQEAMVLASVIKDEILSLPGKLAHTLVGMDAGQVKAKLTEALESSLNQVADRIDKYASEISGSSTADSSISACRRLGKEEQAAK